MGRAWDRGVPAAVCALLTGWLATGSAWAQVPRWTPPQSAPRPCLPGRVVGVGPVGTARVLHLEHALRQAIARSTRFVPAGPVEAAQTLEARAEAGRRAFAAGLEAYESLDMERALAHLSQALEALSGAELPRHLPLLSRAWVLKIAAQWAQGDVTGAQAEARQLLALDPAAHFSVDEFPAEALAQLERLRERRLPAAQAGASAARPPAPERSRVAGRVTLASAAAAPTDLRQLAQAMGVQDCPQLLLVLAQAEPGDAPLRVTALRVESRTGDTLAQGTALFASAEESLVEAVAPLLDAVLELDAPVAAVGPLAAPAAGPRWRRTGYGLLGAGALLLAGSVVLGLQASQRQGELSGLAQNDPRAAGLRTRGRSLALLADVGAVVGLLSGAAGGYLVLRSPPSAHPSPARAQERPGGAPGPMASPLPQPAARADLGEDDLRNH